MSSLKEIDYKDHYSTLLSKRSTAPSATVSFMRAQTFVTSPSYISLFWQADTGKSLIFLDGFKPQISRLLSFL
jgi:hypothetical protein